MVSKISPTTVSPVKVVKYLGFRRSNSVGRGAMSIQYRKRWSGCFHAVSWVRVPPSSMGSVVKVYKKEKHVSWQARICRVGIPKLTLSFCTYDEASDWLNENEESYINNPELFMKEFNRLKELRGRRKKRNGKI